MSDNVGLSTPRGSGTSGYVQKNLAAMRPRDRGAPYSTEDNLREYKQRQPDKGILEHDRKREVEVKVFELRDTLEEEGYGQALASGLSGPELQLLTWNGRVDEEEIDDRCDQLRKKLLADMDRPGVGKAPARKGFKMHQVHELADQKIKESERLRQALKIGKDYEEGGHWKRKEERLKKAQEAESRAEMEREADRDARD